MHILIWKLSMANLRGFHMDPNNANNFEIFKNIECENIESLFNVMDMMIEGNSEIG